MSEQRIRAGVAAAALLCAAGLTAQTWSRQLGRGQPAVGQPNVGPSRQGAGAQALGGQGPGSSTQGPATRTRPGGYPVPQGSFWGGDNQGPDEFSSIWSSPSPPQWSGFPAFPARLQGYGNYPLPVDPNDPTGVGLAPPLPAAEPEPSGWPSWVRLRARKPLPFAVDTGLLIAQAGRVWSRRARDEAFLPSLPHDDFASLPEGAEVQLRSKGALEVLLYESSRLEARGLTSLRVQSLNEQQVSLALDELSWVRLRASARRHSLSLPDGSVLEFQPTGGSDASAGGLGALMALFGGAVLPVTARPAHVEIVRADEPSSYGGRASMTNYGGEPVTWRHAFGETQIGPGQRVYFFLTPPTAPGPAGLAPGDARVRQDGAAATCRAVTDTDVQWCGARISVPAGGVVKFRSFAGPVELSATGG